jgi:hypothetical protein
MQFMRGAFINFVTHDGRGKSKFKIEREADPKYTEVDRKVACKDNFLLICGTCL